MFIFGGRHKILFLSVINIRAHPSPKVCLSHHLDNTSLLPVVNIKDSHFVNFMTLFKSVKINRFNFLAIQEYSYLTIKRVLHF